LPVREDFRLKGFLELSGGRELKAGEELKIGFAPRGGFTLSGGGKFGFSGAGDFKCNFSVALEKLILAIEFLSLLFKSDIKF
jgi:hypothetical protein